MAAKRGPYPGKPSGRGKGLLQEAVHAVGMSRRQSALAVDTVIDCWKNALARHEDVELPIGILTLVRRKTRRVLIRKTNLKGFRRTLYEINRQPLSVQIVKKKFALLNPSQEPEEPSVCSAPLANPIESGMVHCEDRRFHPVRFAYLNQHDLLQRFRW
jgi:hypothetical protein